MARVLIIEDYADLANVLARYLGMVGHEVVAVARDGSSGVEAGLATRPDVALIDMGLPDISGYEVASRLRLEGRRPGMLLVAMTGCEAGWDPARAMAAGFDEYMLKPLDHEVMLRLLARSNAPKERPSGVAFAHHDPAHACVRSPAVAFSWAN